MTVIVGMHVPGQGTHMAADGMVTRDGSTRCPSIVKLHRVGDVIFGAAGSCKSFDFLRRYARDLVDNMGIPEDLTWLLPERLEAAGFRAVDHEAGGPGAWGCHLLVGTPAGLWEVDEELSVARIPSHVPWAIGSGSSYALGAAHALKACHAPEDSLVLMAVRAACHFDSTCGGIITQELIKEGSLSVEK